MIPLITTLFSIIAIAVETEGLSTRSLATTSITDTTFTIPRAYHGEVEKGTYPSPLHQVHVQSILTDEEAANCLKVATSYAESTGCWNNPDSDRHVSYSTCDFSILDECSEMQEYLAKINFDERMWNELSNVYGIPVKEMSYLDLFCAHYQSKTASSSNTMDRLAEHRDGSMLSFTLTLSDPDTFVGGGTYFDALRDVKSDDEDGVLQNGVIRPTRAGDAVLHSGKALHGAHQVTEGKRTVLVAFVEVAPWWERAGAISSACRDWGRMDVAAARYQRQSDLCTGGNNGWMLNNKKWICKGNDISGRSALTGFCPAFPSVAARGSAEFQRQRKLEAEDILLRTFLLNEDELTTSSDILGGDVTIL